MAQTSDILYAICTDARGWRLVTSKDYLELAKRLEMLDPDQPAPASFGAPYAGEYMSGGMGTRDWLIQHVNEEGFTALFTQPA